MERRLRVSLIFTMHILLYFENIVDRLRICLKYITGYSDSKQRKIYGCILILFSASFFLFTILAWAHEVVKWTEGLYMTT